MSDKFSVEEVRVLPNEFYRVRPQVLRVVLQTLERALAATMSILGDTHIYEPRFTRQLLVDFERARDGTPGSPRYDITHQAELPITDTSGAVARFRRLDFRLVFLKQVGRSGDYLCIEVKYLDTRDRRSDYDYVSDGVDRIVIGDYAKGHPWAIMVGVERHGPLTLSAQQVSSRLVQTYGSAHGLKNSTSVRLPNVYESDHPQAGGPHQITILHAFYLWLSAVDAGSAV